jgi:hypothetical protein
MLPVSKNLYFILVVSLAILLKGCTSYLRGDHDHGIYDHCQQNFDNQSAINQNDAGVNESDEPNRDMAMRLNSEQLFVTSNNSNATQYVDPISASVFAFWTSERIKSAAAKTWNIDRPSGGENITGNVTSPFTSKPLEHWTFDGAVQKAVGRIFYCVELEDKTLNCFRCSGTSVTDNTSGRSIILTAAHCVYDDVIKKFTKFGIFVPNQDEGGNDDETDMTMSLCFNIVMITWLPAIVIGIC